MLRAGAAALAACRAAARRPGRDPEAFLAAASSGRPDARRLLAGSSTRSRSRSPLLARPPPARLVDWLGLLERAPRGDSTLQVWSAACATGEEAYSLVLLAAEAFLTDVLPSRWSGRISRPPRSRRRRAATTGSGRCASDERQRQRYFTARAPTRRRGRVRRHVRFQQHNLAATRSRLGPQAFDVIVCRNVLIYFDGATIDRLRAALALALFPGGMLILGSADALCGTVQRLARLGEREAPSPGPRRRPLGRADGRPEPFDAEGSHRQGLADLEAGEASTAVGSLRRALYVDQSFALAAFTLGRAHEAAGDGGSARRAYEQALRTVALADGRYDHLLERAGLGDVTAACRARLAVLGSTTTMRAR